MLFALQLLLNVCWPGFFFALHMLGAALAEVLLPWVAILVTAISFWPLSRAAGWLMVPYLLWVAFASVLNYPIWRLNACARP